MAPTLQPCSILLLAIILIALARPADAFGAGYVARGSSQQGTNFRHGDILNAVYFLSHAHSTLVRQIYFGNWLRDFSQLIDRKAMEVVPEPILRAVVAVFAQIQFGYTTKEFEVTAERLGSYRPEEHIDNPRGYEGGAYGQLRLQVHPEELSVDTTSGMKSYIASQKVAHINDTSLDFIEKQLVAAIACGRARDYEAYTHLGAALHTLEDFVAHSNWLELCLQLVGSEMARGTGEENPMTNVFAFTGLAARVKTYRGSAPPLVTGTFGALDLYQTLLGEVDDKISAMSLPGLQMRTKGPPESLSSLSKALIGILGKFEGADFQNDITSITKSATEQPADWGKLNEAPELLWNQLHPVFRVRDKIVRWVYDHLTIDVVANAIAAISTALDKLVYRIIGIFMGPVLKDIAAALQHQSDQLLMQDQQVRMITGEQSIFDESSVATDPTHSQLCKDHYDHDLNELAGLVATKITTFTIKKVIEVWQPGSLVEVKPVLNSILDTLHHPFNYSKESEVQGLMVAEVIEWCTQKQKNDPTKFAAMFQRLDRQHMAARIGEETERIAHSHVPAMTATYTGSNQISGTTAHDLVTIGANRAQIGFIQKITENIEKNITKGAFKGLSLDDLPGIKQILDSSPSAETPNPIDQSLIRIPGMSLLSVFEDIDIGEIVAAPGMGVILKDAVIGMRLQDTEWVERQQAAARERLGALEDRPAKELLKLLDVHPVEKTMERPTEESKTRRLMNKLKIGSSST